VIVTDTRCSASPDGEHLVELLSRDGLTLDAAVRRCAFCSKTPGVRVAMVEPEWSPYARRSA
jgi:hypothetical protein